MKTKYNIIIERILIIILIVPLLALVALKYVLKVIERLVKATRVVVECSIDYVRTIFKKLVEELSVKS